MYDYEVQRWIERLDIEGEIIPVWYCQDLPDFTSLCKIVGHRAVSHKYHEFNWVKCNTCRILLSGQAPSALDYVNYTMLDMLPKISSLFESESPFLKYIKT